MLLMHLEQVIILQLDIALKICTSVLNQKISKYFRLRFWKWNFRYCCKKLMPYSKITLIDVDNLAVKMSKFNLKKNNIISNNNVLKFRKKEKAHKEKFL